MIYIDELRIVSQDPQTLIKQRDTVILSPPGPGVCDQLGKVPARPYSETGMFRLHCRLNFHDPCTPRTEATGNYKFLSFSSDKTKGISEEAGTITWQTDYISSGSPSSTPPLPTTADDSESLTEYQSYDSLIVLPDHCMDEIQWWIQNLPLQNGKAMITPAPDMIVSSNASKKGWGAAYKTSQTGGRWSRKDRKLHINILEMNSADFCSEILLQRQEEPTCPSFERQSNHCHQYSQNEWNQESSPLLVSKTNFGILHTKQVDSDSETLGRGTSTL